MMSNNLFLWKLAFFFRSNLYLVSATVTPCKYVIGDLKLENTLLDGSPAPWLKIYDFGYSKVIGLHHYLRSCFPIIVVVDHHPTILYIRHLVCCPKFLLIQTNTFSPLHLIF
ncbi:hypothetical protein P3S67_014930 [Capsicum chacoense]